MFDGQPQQELDALLHDYPELRQLYDRHKALDKQVIDAELGVAPVDDTQLALLKREKLQAKDRLTQMVGQLQA